MRPYAATEGHDVPWLIDELVPGRAAVVDDVVERRKDTGGESSVADELPGAFNRIQFGQARQKE